MQFSNLIAAASVLTGVISAPAYTIVPNRVKFLAESDSEAINGKGLTSIHSGAAINNVYLGTDPQVFNYDVASDHIYLTLQNSDDNDYNLTLSTNVRRSAFPELQAAQASAKQTEWAIDCGYLKGNGSDHFYAAMNTGDVYGTSKRSYEVGLFPGDSSPSGSVTDAHKIKIKAILMRVE